MANSLIYFGSWNSQTENTLTDDQLLALPEVQKQGIELGSIAYSNILNALMRQVTKMTKVFGDLVSLKSGQDVNTTISDTVLQTRIQAAIEKITLDVAVKIANVTLSPVTRKDIVVNSQGLVTTFKDLVLDDLPAITIGKVTGLRGDLDSRTPMTRTIAGVDLTANRSRDDIIGIATGSGFVKRTAANTYSIDPTIYVPETRTIAGVTLSGNITRDQIIGVSTNGFVKRTGANTYAIDNNTYLTSITKAMIESVLTGNITSHVHSQYLTAITKGMVEGVLTGNIGTHTHSQYLTNVTWAQVGSKPTTLGGFGITDGQPLNAGLTALASLMSGATQGYIRKTGANAYELKNEVYALASQITVSKHPSSPNITIWRGTQAEYDALNVPENDNGIYVIS